MAGKLHLAVLQYLLLAVLCAALQAEIVDRIAVSVGNTVITTSDMNLQIRVSAFLDGSKPDFSPAARHNMADRLVEQALIRKELETSRYPLPTPEEMEPEYQAFRAKRFPNADTFAQALQAAGITEQELKEELVWQRAITQFLDVRFRPGVQVTDQDIEQYFNTVVAPLARQAHPGQPVNLADYRTDIEVKLSGDRANQEMDRWLADARRRTVVVVHEEAFQ
jgi:peptidyl-prolyl cis-trans isomerase SurA